MYGSASGRAVLFKLLKVEIQVAHDVLLDLMATCAQLLPIRHFVNYFGALVANYICGTLDVVAHLGIANQALGGRLKFWRIRQRLRRRYSYAGSFAIARRENFRQMENSHPAALPAQRAADMHETRIINCCANLSSRI